MNKTAKTQLVKIVAKASRLKNEAPIELALKACGLGPFEREYRFAAHHVGWDDAARRSGRAGKGKLLSLRLSESGLKDWRFDFAWPEEKVALEIDGAAGFGRHTTRKGFEEDCRKFNAAAVLGWRVLRVAGGMVRDGSAVDAVAKCLSTARGNGFRKIPFNGFRLTGGNGE